MKGAMAEDCAKISSAPSNSRTTTIGISHHNLRAHRKPSSSAMMPTRRPAARIALGIVTSGLRHEAIPEDEKIHAAAHERGVCLARCIDDGLPPEVEGR